jgi:hypothetical protein
MARPLLEQLAITLRSARPIQPRGAALTRLFSQSHTAFSIDPTHPNQLYDAAREALSALDAGQGALGNPLLELHSPW